MRTISAEEIQNSVKKLFLNANQNPSPDVLAALKSAHQTEAGVAKEALRQIIENADIAKKTNLPCCQDTGMALVFLEIGLDVHIQGELMDCVHAGVREAYREGYFRMSVLDPITRINTKDNTPAVIHTELVPGDRIKITAVPKGFGSENMSVLKMLTPSEGIDGIKKTVVDAVKAAGGSPCPPVVLGIGIGGTLEKCALVAKKQLLRPIGGINPDETLAKLEAELLEEINALGMGAMGFAGKHYCLGVNIGKYPTHISALPVCVNFQCHAARHQSEVI